MPDSIASGAGKRSAPALDQPTSAHFAGCGGDAFSPASLDSGGSAAISPDALRGCGGGGANGLCPIGWQEWAALPDLGYDRLKVKIDTGAKTCSLHAWKIQREGIVEDESGQPMPLLRIRLDADPESPGKTKDILAPMIRCSLVTDTSGRKERRPVILTRLVLGSFEQIVEVNITNREAMRFRMLIGRTALCPHFVVDVNREYLLGPPRPHSRGSQCAYGARL